MTRKCSPDVSPEDLPDGDPEGFEMSTIGNSTRPFDWIGLLWAIVATLLIFFPLVL